MFVPGYGRTYDEGNTDRFPVDGDGFIDFCIIFPNLGSKISSDCTDDADIDNRIAQASKMFGYVRKKLLYGSPYVCYPSYSSAASSGGSTRRRSRSWSRSRGKMCAPWPERQRTSRGRSHQRVRAREAVWFARDQELHRRERTTLARPRCTDAPQQAASATLNGLGWVYKPSSRTSTCSICGAHTAPR